MRIADVLNSALEGIKYVVDLHEGELDLTPYLGLPEGVEYVPGMEAAGRRFDDQTLVVDLFGPDPRRHRPLDRMPATLTAAAGARRAVLLFGYAESELPVHRVVDLLRGEPWRVSAAVPLGYRHISIGVVLEPVAAGVSFTDEHNLLRLSELGTRTLRARLVAREAELERLRGGRAPESSADDDLDTDQPRTEIEALREELDMMRVDRQRLRELERSTTYQVGRIVVDALAKPGKRTLEAPRTLVRMFRQRSERARFKTANADEKPKRAPSLQPLRTQKLITPLSAPVDEDLTGVLTLAGVWPAESERVLAPDARAVTLQPNQAVMQLWRSDPDVLLVQASAMSAGSPWAGLGTSVGVARDEELRAVLDAAARRNVPSILWFDRPPFLVPGLDAVADRFDLVLGDHGPLADVPRGDAFSLGVQLARFGVLAPPGPGATAEDATVACFLGSLDPRLGLRRRARLVATLQAAGARGLRWFDDGAFDDLAGQPPPGVADLEPRRAGYLSTTRRPAAYREHHAWIATPALGNETMLHHRALEQLAAGANVVTTDAVSVTAALRPHILNGSHDPAGAIDALLGRPVREPGEQLAVLRAVYERAATARWLTRLARACGLSLDPEAAYATTLVVDGIDAGRVASVAGAVLAQRSRPVACALRLAPGVPATAAGGAIAALKAQGVAARVVTAESLSTTMIAARTPWCAVVTLDTLQPDALLDLHVARACSSASVITFGSGPVGRLGAFPTLVRTDLVINGTVVVTEDAAGARWDAPAALVAAFDPTAIGANA
jgi:hypothetical protein